MIVKLSDEHNFGTYFHIDLVMLVPSLLYAFEASPTHSAGNIAGN